MLLKVEQRQSPSGIFCFLAGGAAVHLSYTTTHPSDFRKIGKHLMEYILEGRWVDFCTCFSDSGAWFPKLLSVGDTNILEENLDENIKPGTGATQHITHLVSALDSTTVFTAALWQQDSGTKRGWAVSTVM